MKKEEIIKYWRDHIYIYPLKELVKAKLPFNTIKYLNTVGVLDPDPDRYINGYNYYTGDLKPMEIERSTYIEFGKLKYGPRNTGFFIEQKTGKIYKIFSSDTKYSKFIFCNNSIENFAIFDMIVCMLGEKFFPDEDPEKEYLTAEEDAKHDFQVFEFSRAVLKEFLNIEPTAMYSGAYWLEYLLCDRAAINYIYDNWYMGRCFGKKYKYIEDEKGLEEAIREFYVHWDEKDDE